MCSLLFRGRTFWRRQHFSQSVGSTADHVHMVQSAKNRFNMNFALLWNPKTSKANCEGFDFLDVMVHHWISDSRVQVPILKPRTWRRHISSKNQEKLGDAASHPRGLNSCITLLWKPQNLQRKCHFFAWVHYHTRVTGSAGQILCILTCNIRRSASISGHHYSWREHTLPCIRWRGARTIVGSGVEYVQYPPSFSSFDNTNFIVTGMYEKCSSVLHVISFSCTLYFESSRGMPLTL